MPRPKTYSPALDQDLIPRLYHLGKARGVPMTKLASAFVRRCLDEETNETATAREDSPAPDPAGGT